jgi:hypothetical protein
MRMAERNTTSASARDVKQANTEKPTRPMVDITKLPDVKPPLEHVDVEEWDCPKPGAKRAMPKEIKDNIRKNRKAYEEYYKHRADSIHSAGGSSD